MAFKIASDSVYKPIWDRMVLEGHKAYQDVMFWIQRLSDGEKIVGMIVFALLLLLLIVSKSGRRRDKVSHGRQFSGAFLLVVFFSFGAGWILEAGPGSYAYLFNR